jgi:YHS domain-containing protein
MRLIRLILSTLALLTISQVALAAPPINTLEREGLFGYEHNGIAIRGYDTVAYFTQSKPVEGDNVFTTQWSGATWKFSSQEHLDLFVRNPEKYAPQYGGYCAYGVAQMNLVKIEPEQWTIIDEKL